MRAVGHIPGKIAIGWLALLLAKLIVVTNSGGGAQTDNANRSTLARTAFASSKRH
jgi:hypothetical protein